MPWTEVGIALGIIGSLVTIWVGVCQLAAWLRRRRSRRRVAQAVPSSPAAGAGGAPAAEPYLKDFFISYNQADREWAEWIAGCLEEDGYTTVIQSWDMPASANFILEMQRAATECGRTIAVLSDHYLSALYTQPEWAAAFAQDPTGEKRKLVLVRVSECQPTGLLAAIKYLDLVGLDEDATKAALLDDVKPDVPRTKPAFPEVAPTPARERAPFPGALPAIWNIPHLRNPNFTGRQSLLTAIEDALGKGQLAALTQQAIVGLGGVGKTQLALEYAYRHTQDYSLIWWVRSEEPAQLASDYAGLAVELDLPLKDESDQRVIVQAVRRWLERNTGWLLILDNAPDPDAIRDYLPRGGAGHLLITSRDPNWGAVASPLQVQQFERDESVAFLRRRTGQEEGAAELADALGDLPLALEQAAAYIEVAGSTLTDYLDLFNTRRADLWQKEKPPEGYHATVDATWSLAMDRVRSDSPPAANLLNLCAFVAPDDIPLSLLREHADHLPDSLATAVRDPVSLNDAVAVLRRYSLVRTEADSLSLHRLVQAVTRDRLSDQDQRTWAAAAARVVSAAFPDEPDDVRTWPVCARLLPHALAAAVRADDLEVPGEQAGHLLNDAGVYLLGRAQFAPARALLEHALAILENGLGPDHPDVALALNNLASVLQEQGDLPGAHQGFERALAISERALGPDDPQVASALNNLARVLRGQGDLPGARQRFERALAINEKALGPDHPDVATTLNNLASVLHTQGDLPGARERFERALAVHEKALGPDHPSVGIDAGNLGGVLHDLGDLDGARRHHERAIAIHEEAYGPDHPHVARALNNLAFILEEQGDLPGAREHFDRALAIFEKVFGPTHLDVLTALHDLARVLRDHGDLPAARERLERALRIFRDSLGEDHPRTRTVKRHLELLDT